MVPKHLIHHQNGYVICDMKGISVLVTTMSLNWDISVKGVPHLKVDL